MTVKIIIKRCIKHGDLTQDKVIKSGISKGAQKYKCRACMKDFHHNHYERNREDIHEKSRLYKSKHREKFRELNRKYKRKNTNSEMSALCPIPQDCENPNKFIQARRRIIYALWDLRKIVKKYDKLRGK